METLCESPTNQNISIRQKDALSAESNKNLSLTEGVYYDRSGVVVRNSRLSDVLYLKTRLKRSDADEVWASHHYTPFQALYEGWQKSLFCLTIVADGKPMAMFGINPESFFSKNAVFWFLSDDLSDRIKIRFLKNSRRFVDMFLEHYSYLHNYVDSRNEKTIKWLKFMGAVVEPSQPYGADNLLFHHFYFKK